MESAKSIFKLLGYIFCFIGFFIGMVLIFIGYSVSHFLDLSISENNGETVGKIISINSNYEEYNENDNFDVIVEYEVDGEKYESELNFYSSDFQIGQEVDILYNKNDVTQISSAKIKNIIDIFSVLNKVGIVIVVISVLLPIISIIRSKVKKKRMNSADVNNDMNYYAQSIYDNYRKEIRNESNKGPINVDSNPTDNGAIKYK